MFRPWVLAAALAAVLVGGPVLAAGDAPAGTPPGATPGGNAPRPAPAGLSGLNLPLPADVKALSSAVGLGRQRLALVISQPRAAGLDLPATTRDAQAVAAALQAGGYVVMRRHDVGVAALRQVLKEFRGRLGPTGAGFIFMAGAGAQVDGQSVLLTRDLAAAEGADAAALRATSLPLSELVQALQVTPSSLRLLVVDAAAPVPGLPPAQRGLVAPVLPDGVMALLSTQPGAEFAPLRPPVLASPPPTDPRALVGSPFGSALVHALTTPGQSGPSVLRQARQLARDGTAGRLQPWLGGRTDEDEVLSDPGMLGALPAVAEQLALRAVRQAAGLNAERVISSPKDRPEPPSADTGLPAPDLRNAAALASAAGTVAAVAGAVEAAKAEAVASAVATATDAVLAAARQAAAMGAGNAGAGTATETAAPPAADRQPVDTRLPDQRDPVDGPVRPPAAPASAPSQEPAATPAATTVPAPPDAAASPTPAAVAVPQLNPHGYAVGDSFTYRHTDARTGRALGMLTQVIRQLTSDDEMQASANDGLQVLDGQGRTRSRSGPAGQVAFAPVEQFWWARPQPGESRDVDFSETFDQAGKRGERHWTGEVEVGDPTLLETPAGRFQVLPMQGNGWYVQTDAGGRPQGGVKWERTVWYSTDLGHPVAIDIVERDGHRQWLRRERIELMQAQTSRTVPR